MTSTKNSQKASETLSVDLQNTTALTHIIVRGARQHNLKGVDLDIPKNKMVIFTGVSGSGKSSMAMDTIFAEGQRRYVESLSAYARQFLGVMDKPDVDKIDGLSPAIAIDQKTTSKNPRSTVGTITEIYDFMRLLFARIGHPVCPECGREIQRQSAEEIVDQIYRLAAENKDFTSERGVRMLILAPLVKDRKGEYSALFDNLKRQGIIRARIDGSFRSLNDKFDLLKTNKHTIDAVVMRTSLSKKLDNRSQVYQSVESALRLANGSVLVSIVKDKDFDFTEDPKEVEDHLFSENFACPVCNISLPDIEPRSFSFNSPHGACPVCDGLGTQLEIDETLVLNKELTVEEGGVLPWNRLFEHSSWTGTVVEAMAKEHHVPLNVPIKQLTKEQLKLILYGTGEKKYRVKYQSKSRESEFTYNATYEGVIPNLKRRHKETESDYIRNEIEKYMVNELCPECVGTRLKKEALAVYLDKKNISEISEMPIADSQAWFSSLPALLNVRELTIADPILKEINYRVKFLSDVGLSYLNLARSSAHLSGGEAQRIRLASQIGSGLSGVLYVLDEPSIGLHQRDQSKLISTLHHLRDLGNTVLVVEHDEETMLESDYIIDFGPGAGERGGQVIAHGTPDELQKDPSSLTGKYLSKKLTVGSATKNPKLTSEDVYDVETGKAKTSRKTKALSSDSKLEIKGATGRNLKNISVEMPFNQIVCVTGVSGSGKSTLVIDTLYTAMRQHFGMKIDQRPEPHKEIKGLEYITNVIAIDQSPIGRTPKSNPATYTKAFDHIRDLFAKTQEAKLRGYGPGRFSFNVKGGRCEACHGEGQIKIEMQFMPDVYVNCEVCQGKRYNREALEITYKGKNISDVLDMTVEDALTFFENIPQIRRKIQTLHEVGLGYIRLGQPATTLSGGEAQRVKLALELSKKFNGHTFYILDEPTTGLHFADLENLLTIIRKLKSKGNTILVIEHNLDIVANSDWIIDLGPEGGAGGGQVLYTGSLTDFLNYPTSYTAEYLRKHLS